MGELEGGYELVGGIWGLGVPFFRDSFSGINNCK